MKNRKDFESKEDFFKYLIDSREDILSEKKAEVKECDSGINLGFYEGSTKIAKSIAKAAKLKAGKEEPHLIITAAINTTKFMDSHDDVHIDGLWDEGLKLNSKLPLLKEHRFNFDNMLAKGTDISVQVIEVSWKDLGYNVDGKTQVLMFTARLYKSRNENMYQMYKDEYVDNHSVGMRYESVKMAIKDGDEKSKEVWNKYYPEIINKDLADKRGYFFPVLKARAIEGSAVARGSNKITPTMSVDAREKAVKTFLGIDFSSEEDEPEYKEVKTFLGIEKILIKKEDN